MHRLCSSSQPFPAWNLCATVHLYHHWQVWPKLFSGCRSSLIIQPNCLDPSPGGDPGSTYVLLGVSWTRVGIWHISHLELPPVTHQTVSSTTLSPFEFSARPCCSLQMRILVWSRTVDCCILWLLNALGSWAAWIGCLMGANHIAEGGKAGTGTWRRYGALHCLYSSSNHIYVNYCTQSS